MTHRFRFRSVGDVILVFVCLVLGVPATIRAEGPGASFVALRPREARSLPLGDLQSGRRYTLLVALESAPLSAGDRATIEFKGPGADHFRKDLHAGDPDLYVPYRPAEAGPATLTLKRADSPGRDAPISVRVEWREESVPPADEPALEAEPNDDWRTANRLILGRDVYGTADDVDYLDNAAEGKSGLDWFRFEVADAGPILVYFQLDLRDRDVSANLRVFTVDARTGRPEPYLAGKDPMEIVHDRERERYSKHLSRTFTKGVYYLQVNANHPDYILRTRVMPTPPYDAPEKAVEAGMHYIMNVGDAWFAQVPREGNIFVRADGLHDTATRCTACHASSFPTEANLTAHRAGYPIAAKDGFQYVMDRIANSITPLYGDDGLNWQRFIAIPLQSQGKQGGILADFEREVSGEPTAMVERFGPFLKDAWENRRDLPADEMNGVVPLDSKFGFAWRDWRVLTEIARRTGDADYARAAANIAAILGDRSADRRIETLQDRIHRLYAWSLIDKQKHANKIKRETGALLALQNQDGGWHESDAKPGPSSVYTTGQLVYTFLEIGLPTDHPALARGLRYLLAQQQDFGGWFQTSTHENFRTPMRETRYAVMALARAFPRPGAPKTSWGNRDDQPARLPRTDSLVHTLDDLENLWDVPEADMGRYSAAIVALLDHPSPLVRASAASCLGRLGRPETAQPLARRLADPSKIVWRASAEALRRLGNQGVGLDAIKAALDDPDVRVRRGAARIFAYQFHGMDARIDLADRLIHLTDDADLLTRLQALRSLRQWFYRTADVTLQKRIVAAYLARMAVEDVAVVRKNLSEGLYILLDENLGGGVSLQKNLAELPEAIRPRVLEARKAVERDVLLGPVLATLEHGNVAQKDGVLQAFDGSFFKGRTYARQPENQIDVGNDREFGFLYEVPLNAIESTFASLLGGPLPADGRRRALQLASFFKLPPRTENAAIQLAVLEAARDPDAELRRAALGLIRDTMSFAGAETDPARTKLISRLIAESDEARPALLAAVGRNSRLAERSEIAQAVPALLARPDAAADLLPLLDRADVSDQDAVNVVAGGWERFDQPQRARALHVLLGRPALVDRDDPPAAVVDLFQKALTDPSEAVREQAVAGLKSLPKLGEGRNAPRLFMNILADDAPKIRRLGLAATSQKSSFWERPDAREHLARLLVDPDAKVRADALDVVRNHRLVSRHPALARRVKALAGDPTLAAKADALLRASGLDPAELTADVEPSRPRLLRFEAFRRTVEPLFYQPGADGRSCAECHANHTILRIAERDPLKPPTDEDVAINYSSALKVVNLGDPESSLLLRKPRSPQGQGGEDPVSPTGLTHVGGPRWENAEHPAYRAILAWIRQAAQPTSGLDASISLSADGHAPGFEPARASDGDLSTIWQTEFQGATPGYPHELIVDLGEPRRINAILYVPRQDASTGRVRDYEVSVSSDRLNWTPPVARGAWPDDPTSKPVPLAGPRARFVRLRGLAAVDGGPVMSAAEVVVETSTVDEP
ncbi:MAG: HEAT repeat domain-containing protein [Paludisphaera borealis]|uniref:discoidin domain-containing protein n=1 Tax=Paludisphaera borealis TaxID=1387353 RepID=UPI00284C72FC|nr:discoidin domain-containing protein [Paludisphaera borealis]MDR3617899.1 HEAT repeat domain-containing protein [Paludisphaera borealis]